MLQRVFESQHGIIEIFNVQARRLRSWFPLQIYLGTKLIYLGTKLIYLGTKLLYGAALRIPLEPK